MSEEFSNQYLSAKYSQLCLEKADLLYKIEKLEIQQDQHIQRMSDIDDEVEAINAAKPIINHILQQIEINKRFKNKEKSKIEVVVNNTKKDKE